MTLTPLKSITNTFRENEALLILCSQVCILHTGLSLISPILPLYAQAFGVSVAWVGFLLTAQFFPRIIINVPIGRLADRWGAHHLLAAAAIIAMLSAVAAGFAPNYLVLLLTRLLQGVATGISQTSGFTYAANVSKPENRARVLSLYQGSFFLGNSIGPVIGGFAAEYFGYRAPFFVYALLALAAGIWMMLRLPDPRLSQVRVSRKQKTEPGFIESMRQMLQHRGVLLGSVIGLLAFYTRGGSRNMGVPLRGSELGLSESQIGLAMTLIFLGNFVTLYLAGALADRFGRKAVIVPSWLMSGAALALLALSSRVELFLLAAILFGISEGIGSPIPAVYVADAADAETQGMAMGVYRTFGDIGLMVGPILLGWIAEWSSIANGMITNSGALIAIALIFFFVAPELQLRKQPATVRTG